MELDLLDRKIAHALQIDGRAPFRAIGTALGVSDQTIARRTVGCAPPARCACSA
jgi:DNA-binding Lrp family transcriptional regulator